MSLQDRIINHFSDSIQTQQESMASLCELIEYASQCLVTTLLNDKKYSPVVMVVLPPMRKRYHP